MPITYGVDAKAPLAHCDECPLRDRTFVAGNGPSRTNRVIVGEAPGKNEVVEGRPFVGKAGGRLNQGLSAKGVDRSAVYITNAALATPLETNPRPTRRDLGMPDRLISEILQKMPRRVMALGGRPLDR